LGFPEIETTEDGRLEFEGADSVSAEAILKLEKTRIFELKKE